MTLKEFWTLVDKTYQERDSWRFGQTAFNVLAGVRPDLSESVRGSVKLDPFHAVDRHDPRVANFTEYLTRKW